MNHNQPNPYYNQGPYNQNQPFQNPNNFYRNQNCFSNHYQNQNPSYNNNNYNMSYHNNNNMAHYNNPYPNPHQFMPPRNRNTRPFPNNNGQQFKNQNNRHFPKKPYESMENKEEIKLWVERRKKNYPGAKNIEETKRKEEEGIVSPKMSQLETKLRKKIKILNSQFDRTARIKEKYWNDLKYFLYDKGNNNSTNIKQKQGKNDEKHEITAEKYEEHPEELGEILENTLETNERHENNWNTHDGNNGHINDMNQQRTIKNQDKNTRKQRKQQKFLEKMQEKIKNKEQCIGDLEPIEDDKLDEIISNIKARQEEDSHDLQSFLESKTNSAQHRYRLNTLTTNLVLDEIFKERSIILQCFRYIVKEDFFKEGE